MKVEHLYKYALKQEKSGNKLKAINCLKKALQDCPAEKKELFSRIVYAIGIIFWEINEKENAIKFLESAINLITEKCLDFGIKLKTIDKYTFIKFFLYQYLFFKRRLDFSSQEEKIKLICFLRNYWDCNLLHEELQKIPKNRKIEYFLSKKINFNNSSFPIIYSN